MRDLESSLACTVCLNSLLRDCGVKTCRVPMHYSDKNAVAHAPIHTVHMHAHKQVST